jgi:hypothetical protein
VDPSTYTYPKGAKDHTPFLTSRGEVERWPTATAHDDGKSPEAHLRMKQRMGERDGTHANRTAITSLAVIVQSNWMTPHGMHGTDHTGKTGRGGEFAKQATGWSTPSAHDGRRPGSDATSTQGANLKRDAELWSTPVVPNGGRTMSDEDVLSRGATDKGKRQVDLANEVRVWMTPNSRDWKSETGSENNTHDKTPNLSRQVYRLHQDPQTNDGPPSSESAPTSRRRLNPRFVEWLMGFPPGWTEL